MILVYLQVQKNIRIFSLAQECEYIYIGMKMQNLSYNFYLQKRYVLVLFDENEQVDHDVLTVVLWNPLIQLSMKIQERTFPLALNGLISSRRKYDYEVP